MMTKYRIGDKIKVKTSEGFKARRITHIDPARYQVRVENMKTKKGEWINIENIYPCDYEEAKQD